MTIKTELFRRLIAPNGRTVTRSVTASLLVLGALALFSPMSVRLVDSAAAQEEPHSGGGGGHSGGGGGSGGGGHDDGGHDDGGDDCGDEGCGDDGGHGGGGHGGTGQGHWRPPGGSGGAGHGGNIEDLVFHGGGPRGEGGAGRGGGGRPPWAGGAVPEDLELGRLNVARAPESTRARALREAYAGNLDKNGDGIVDADADPDAVDSPMANLALYEQAIADGAWTLMQAAGFLGRAADKTIAITPDTVYALHTILGIEDPDDSFAGFEYDRAASVDSAVLAAVFAGENVAASGVAGFARAADDVRAIVQFYHDHPEAIVSN